MEVQDGARRGLTIRVFEPMTSDAAAGEVITLPYTRVYGPENGDTVFLDEELTLTVAQMWEGRIDATTGPLAVSEASLRRVNESESAAHLHGGQARQFIIILRGEVETEVSDGTRRRFGPGDITLIDDVASNGHVSRWLGEDEHLMLVLKLAP